MSENQNHEPFEEIFLPVQTALRGYLYAVTRDSAATDELFQEVAVLLWQKYGAYGRSRDLRAWALGMARLQVLKRRQAFARSRLVFSEELVESLSAVVGGEAADDDWRLSHLADCMQKLPIRDRLLMGMRFEQDKSIGAIAAKIRKSVAATAMSMMRVRRWLRNCVEKSVAMEKAGAVMGRETEQLLSRYLDGVETPEEFAQLEQLALHDPAVRQELVQLAKLDSMMRILIKEMAAARGFSMPGEGDIASAPRLWSTGWLRGIVAAAAVLAICVGGVCLWRGRQPGVPGDVANVGAKTNATSLALSEPAEGRLVALSGMVRVVRADSTGQRVVASVGAEVRVGETILTATNSSALFAYADGSTLCLYPGCELALSRTAAGPGLDLRRGAMDAAIRKQPDGQHLRILGELMRAVIVGTEFRLVVQPEAKAKWLGVREGVVEVTRVADGQKVVLRAGNYAGVAPNLLYMSLEMTCPFWKEVSEQTAGTPYP